MYTKHKACVLESSYSKMALSSLFFFLFFKNNRVAPAISSEICAGDSGQRMGCDKEEFQAKKYEKAIGRDKLNGE